MNVFLWFCVALLFVLSAYGAFRVGLRSWKRSRELSERVRIEDALKHIHAQHQGGHRASPESLAGSLHLSMKYASSLIVRMERQGLLQSSGGGLRLSPAGLRLTLQVIRAHRLWERYLADEVGMDLLDIHRQADRREHVLTPVEADALEVQLGYPRSDPHGDPIPSADGELAAVEGIALCDWPANRVARIVHIEDEPPAVAGQIMALGLKPGMIIEVIEASKERIVITDGLEEYILAPLVAANIQVVKDRRDTAKLAEMPLSRLRQGEAAAVARLSDECAGLTRRRLLDLGITPGTRVEAALTDAFKGLTAYRVRGSVVALRQRQAEHILVFPETDYKPQTP
jgi:DtxR family Mn-dependent transcriptional regulator